MSKLLTAFLTHKDLEELRQLSASYFNQGMELDQLFQEDSMFSAMHDSHKSISQLVSVL